MTPLARPAGPERGDERVTLVVPTHADAEAPGAVAVDDAHLVAALPGARVEELVDLGDRLVDGLAEEVELERRSGGTLVGRRSRGTLGRDEARELARRGFGRRFSAGDRQIVPRHGEGRGPHPDVDLGAADGDDLPLPLERDDPHARAGRDRERPGLDGGRGSDRRLGTPRRRREAGLGTELRALGLGPLLRVLNPLELLSRLLAELLERRVERLRRLLASLRGLGFRPLRDPRALRRETRFGLPQGAGLLLGFGRQGAQA